jgi:hypothetical protein
VTLVSHARRASLRAAAKLFSAVENKEKEGAAGRTPALACWSLSAPPVAALAGANQPAANGPPQKIPIYEDNGGYVTRFPMFARVAPR